jgi:lipid-A-disaccharide synthase
MGKRLYIIAGEASGDLHGANLVKALKKLQPDLDVQGWGGDLMQEAGVRITKHYRELAFMGFAEVVANLRTISKNFKRSKADIAEFAPDAVILIDYPGFNLRMAPFIKSLGIPIHYYISPQVWAWKESRVKQIKTYVDHLYCILPFEHAFFAKHNFAVEFVGHPLLDVVAARSEDPEFESKFRAKNNLDDRPIIALVPGSRAQEINRILPVMCSVIRSFPQFQFVVAGAPSTAEEVYSTINPKLKVVCRQTYDLFHVATAGLVTSGTATLEAALHGMPQVVCYKGGTLSYLIAKRLIKVKYISLVNLIMDDEIVTELIQNELNTSRLNEELKKLLNPTHRSQVGMDYANLETKLGGPGASSRTATLIIKSLNER